MIGKLFTKVAGGGGDTCLDATVTNSATYTDTVVSGGTLLLPNENITVNGNLLVNKPSVEDYDVEVIGGDGEPISVVVLSTGEVMVVDSIISIAGGNIYVTATQPLTITHEDTNGNPVNTSLNGTVVTVNDLPCSKELDILVPYSSGDGTATFTIVADSDGTITTEDTTGLTNVTYEVNSVPTTLPFTLAVGDVLTINFDTASADGVIKLEGTYA